jgi:4'-phosphopantetheinyl transferase
VSNPERMTSRPSTQIEALPDPGTLPIPSGLQVWWAQVDVGNLDDELRATLAVDLNPATLAKVHRFRRIQDSDRGLAAHALLRRMLAAVVGGRPAELVLSTRCAACGKTEHGKPYLDLGSRSAPVEINLTHSADMVCVALAPAGVQVGVDVEERRAVDWSGLRRSVFADSEWAVTEAAADPDRCRMDAWARKESSVKASGHGLSLSLHGVVIADAAVADSWTATLPDGAGATAGWDLSLVPHASAAVAVHDPGPESGRPAVPEPPAVHHVSLG